MATDFGTDVRNAGDVERKDTIVSGPQNLGYALVRRLSTPRGKLAAINGNPDYGLDVRDMLHGGMTVSEKQAWQAAIARECEKDQRVGSCKARVDFDDQAGKATIVLNIVTADDLAPFEAVIAVSADTVTLIRAALLQAA